MSKQDDKYNCWHEYEQEQAEEAEQEKHLEGLCDGAPRCGYCLSDKLRAKESLGG